MQEGTSALDAAEAARLVGPGAADRDGRGNVNVGDGGVAFVLAAAAGTPGGPDTVRPQQCWACLTGSDHEGT